MALGGMDRLRIQISELGQACTDLRSFQEGLLDILDSAVGFDKAVLNGYCEGRGEDIHSRGYDKPPGLGEGPSYVAEYEPQEIHAFWRTASADVDVLSSQRRSQLSVYRNCMWPERVTTFALIMWPWRNGVNGVFGINLARTGRGARFHAAELGTIEQLLTTIQPTDAFVRLREPKKSPFDAWADHVRLSHRERAVADLAVRGLKNPEIAEQLGIKPQTVRNHMRSVFRKAQLTTRSELAYDALKFDASLYPTAELHEWMKSILVHDRLG